MFHDISHRHSKLLGGGVESMSITEAFGGEQITSFILMNVLYDK